MPREPTSSNRECWTQALMSSMGAPRAGGQPVGRPLRKCGSSSRSYVWGYQTARQAHCEVHPQGRKQELRPCTRTSRQQC